MGFAIGNRVRVYIKWNNPLCKPKWIQSGIGAVNLFLNHLVFSCDCSQFSDRSPVYPGNSLFIGHRRQNGIADSPVEQGPLAGPAGPLINTPVSLSIAILITGKLSLGIFGVHLSVRQVDDFTSGLGLGSSRHSEFPFITVINLYRRTGNKDCLGLGQPTEIITLE